MDILECDFLLITLGALLDTQLLFGETKVVMDGLTLLRIV